MLQVETMENLMQALDKGKRRGYEEIRAIENKNYLFQYFLKKERDQYVTYVMYIEESKIDSFEDYAIEEIKFFQSFNEVADYFHNKGADINRFAAIKRTLPF